LNAFPPGDADVKLYQLRLINYTGIRIASTVVHRREIRIRSKSFVDTLSGLTYEITRPPAFLLIWK
jgi:hypothetical protein